MGTVAAGTWVEIEQLVLGTEQRAEGLPADTAATPLMMWVNGFLADDAAIGDEVSVKTIIGRTLTGVLRTVNPSYTHSFGDTVAELLTIGTEYEK